MPRHSRLDFHGAIHYVQIQGREEAEIFFNKDTIVSSSANHDGAAAKVRHFARLLVEVCEACNTTLHAYCTESNGATLVLQRDGMPLEAFMRRLGGRYAKHLRAHGGLHTQQVFRSRYLSKVIAPEYLPHAVRRAQHRASHQGRSLRTTGMLFSSEQAHLGAPSDIPLDTHSVRHALEMKGYRGLRGYRDFMAQDDTPYVAKLFSRGSPLDPRIVGGRIFVQQAHHRAAHPEARVTEAELTSIVANLLNASPADIHAATHRGALGRSLVAWYGLRSGAATLTEIGRWFNVTGATLGQSMSSHRKAHPEMFGKNIPKNIQIE